MSEILNELRAESDEDERLERQWLSEMASAGRWDEIRHYFGDDEYRDGAPTVEADTARAFLSVFDSATRGADITPGHDQLHHYWTKGEGLAKWAGSPHPWTTLVALLTEHVGPEKAKVFASKWHHEVFGIWVGEKKGANPLGPG